MENQAWLLDLPDSAMLSVLSHLDGLSSLRLSLSSHAVGHRLGSIPGLWRDVALRMLGLAPYTRLRPSADAPLGPGTRHPGTAAPRAPPSPAPTPATATAATGALATVLAMAPATEAAGAATGAVAAVLSPDPAPAEAGAVVAPAAAPASTPVEAGATAAPHSMQPGFPVGRGCTRAFKPEAEQCRSALLSYVRFSRWHNQRSLRLARLSAGLAACSSRGQAAWRGPPAGAVRLQMSRDGSSRLGVALTAQQLSHLLVCADSDVRIRGFSCRAFAASATPSGARCTLVLVVARNDLPLAWLYFNCMPPKPTWQPLGNAALEDMTSQIVSYTACSNAPARPLASDADSGGDSGGGGGRQVSHFLAPEVWHMGGASAANDERRAQFAPTLRRREVPFSTGCSRKPVSGDGIDGECVGSHGGDGGGDLVRLIVRLVAAGAERLRIVSSVAVVPREQLLTAAMRYDVTAMCGAGMDVVDLAGVFHFSTMAGGGHTESSGRSGPTPAAVQVVQEQAAGGDAPTSERLRETVERLASERPGVQVLVLPAVLPRAGRAVRCTPARTGGIKLSAPRLLQLMVPVLSQLRLSMSALIQADGSLQPPRLHRLRHVILVVEAEAEALESALRHLAASTLDRSTGMVELCDRL